MIRLIVVSGASIGLILFVAFVVSRLLRARTRGMSIRLQVFIALATIVGGFAFGLGVMVLDRIEARASRLARQAALDEATALAGIVAGEMGRAGTSIEEVADRLEIERRGGADLRFELLGPGGRQLFPSGDLIQPGEPGSVSVEAPIRLGEDKRGAVRVVKPTVVTRALLADLAPTVLVISLVLGAAAALAAVWIGRAIAAPIEALSRFAEQVSLGQNTAPPPFGFGREVKRLTQSIDSMRRQLQGRPFVETFAADLSHELKNPVAAIRASAEVLEESALEEPLEARRFVARIREATQRIERLLEDLLGLARIEARGIERFEPVDLGKLARRTLEPLLESEAQATLRVTGDVRVRGDASWLGRALGNLTQNAVAHSEPGSEIGVTVGREGAVVVVSVENRGFIPQHVCANLFRRFVTTRADKGGTGLGLAITRAIAEAHAGRVTLVLPGPPTVLFRLELPAVGQPGGVAEGLPLPPGPPALRGEVV